MDANQVNTSLQQIPSILLRNNVQICAIVCCNFLKAQTQLSYHLI